MKLTSIEAFKWMSELANKGAIKERVLIHCKSVGDSAGIIAKAMGLDEDFAKTLGYIHDIGKSVTEHKHHDIEGYNLVKGKGYEEEYASICMTHSYLNNDHHCTAGGFPEDIPFRVDYVKNHEYTIYEKIINLCDLMCKRNVMTLDKRLIDLITRKGAHENTQYHVKEAYKLKAFIDEKLGYNVYDLFPNIEI